MSIKQITLVFCDILPDYKIREDLDSKKDGKVTLSKEVKRLREQETFLLESYKKFLQVLETFSKFNPLKLSDSLHKKYLTIKIESFESYSVFLNRLSHFNFIKNVIKMVASKLASKIVEINKI